MNLLTWLGLGGVVDAAIGGWDHRHVVQTLLWGGVIGVVCACLLGDIANLLIGPNTIATP